MKNVTLINHASTPVSPGNSPGGLVCLGGDNDVYVVIDDVISQYSTAGRRFKRLGECLLPFADVVSVHYQFCHGNLCLLLRSGKMMTLESDLTADSLDPVEVGDFESEVLAAGWSPDEELLAVASSTGADKLTLTLVDSERNLVGELDLLTPGEPTEHSHHVGWGAEETQFKGAGARAKQRDHSNTGAGDAAGASPLVTSSTQQPVICWREEKCDIFVVSLFHPREQQCRRFLVLDRQLNYLCSNDPKSPLLSSLIEFRPCGDLLACQGISPLGHFVHFYERNGLRHGEFKLPVPRDQSCTIDRLTFNPSSDVILVFLQSNGKHSLLVYTRRNYFWYQAQSYSLPSKCVFCVFDVINPFKAFILFDNGSLSSYHWRFDSADISSRDQISANHDRLFAVTNGRTLLVTPYRTVLPPPPIAFYQVECDSEISQSFLSSNSLFIVTSTVVELYSLSGSKLSGNVSATEFEGFKLIYSKYPEKRRQLALPECSQSTHFIHWAKVNERKLATLKSHESELKVIFYHINDRKLEEEGRIDVDIDSEVVGLEVANGAVYLCLRNGEVLHVNESNLENVFTFTVTPERFRVFWDPKSKVVDFICQTRQGGLYVNEHAISNCCTSFALHYINLPPDCDVNSEKCNSDVTGKSDVNTDSRVIGAACLIFTTHKHQLNIVKLPLDPEYLLKRSPDGESGAIVYKRKVERGSEIVGGCDTFVILQMPRGNLETIHPKPLLISLIQTHINCGRYLEAFTLCQKQRLDMNILCEFNFTKFLGDLGTILARVNNHLLLNLFISELNTEKCLLDFDRLSEVPFQEKVTTVCEKLIQVVSESPETIKDQYYLSVLMSHAKLGQIEQALQLVKEVDFKTAPQSSSSEPEGLKFLLLMVDVDSLFDIALGMYDKSLALKILEKSKKDPKEMLPILDELFAGTSEHEQRYRIDDHLRKHEKALASLVKFQTNFDIVFNYITLHDLYKPGLSHLEEKSHNWNRVAEKYSQILLKNGEYLSAGVYLVKLDKPDLACRAFVSAKDFTLAKFYLDLLVSTEVKDYFQLREGIISGLESVGKVSEAADLLSSFDQESSVSLLLKYNRWSEARSLVAKLSRPDLLTSLIIPGLHETLDQTVASMENSVKSCEEMCVRITEVATKKSRIREHLQRGEEGGLEGSISEFSSVSGVSSMRSGSSSGSRSGSRGKRAKKQRSLKHNSPEEDLAILEEIKKQRESVQSSLDSLTSLLVNLSLVGVSTNDRLRSAINSCQQLVTRMNNSLHTVWKSPFMFRVPDDPSDYSAVTDDTHVSVLPLKTEDLLLFVQPQNVKLETGSLHFIL